MGWASTHTHSTHSQTAHYGVPRSGMDWEEQEPIIRVGTAQAARTLGDFRDFSYLYIHKKPSKKMLSLTFIGSLIPARDGWKEEVN